MKHFAKILTAAALMTFAAMAQTTGEHATNNSVTRDSPQINDYYGGRKVTYNEPFSAPDDPMRMYGGSSVQGPAADPDNTALTPALQQLIDSVHDITDEIIHQEEDDDGQQ